MLNNKKQENMKDNKIFCLLFVVILLVPMIKGNKNNVIFFSSSKLKILMFSAHKPEIKYKTNTDKNSHIHLFFNL
jgi:hypothetical protein